jgi:UDP-glucose 6-dehydrogenase
MQAAQKYKIGVVGTGVVGSGILKAWVTRGYNVVGYDVNHETIDLLNLEGYTVQHLNKFHQSDADVIFICISTPQSDDGSIFLDYLLNGIEFVGDWIEKRVLTYRVISLSPHSMKHQPVSLVRISVMLTYPKFCVKPMPSMTH